MEQALSVINSLTPDPLALGSRRMLISEYGLYETNCRQKRFGERRPFFQLQNRQGSSALSLGRYLITSAEMRTSIISLLAQY